MGLFDYFKKKKLETLAEGLNEGVNAIKMVIYYQLGLALKDKYSEHNYDTDVFAAAVTNWLFLQSSSQTKAGDFYNKKQRLVEKEASLLKSYFPNDEVFLVNVYSTAFHWNNIINSEGVVNNYQQNQDCIEKLKNWELLIPQNELVSPNNFKEEISSFYSKYGPPKEED